MMMMMVADWTLHRRLSDLWFRVWVFRLTQRSWGLLSLLCWRVFRLLRTPDEPRIGRCRNRRLISPVLCLAR
jgi:hypothetical protein